MAEWPRVVSRKLHEWNAGDAHVPKGVLCIESDTGRQKIGTGERYSDTPYLPSVEPVTRRAPSAGAARYFIPSMDEWHKAAFYDPNKGGTGAGGWWIWATQSDTNPAWAGQTATGDGVAAADGNSAASGQVITWSGDPEGKGFLSVGTAGGASAYGTYDQMGNTTEVTEGPGGGSFTDNTKFVAVGGTAEFDAEGQVNYGLRYQLRYSAVNGTRGYAFHGMRVASLTNPDSLDNFVDVADTGNAADDVGANAYQGLGIGSVAYDYKIGKYEVTNAEYCDFLNSIGETDPNAMYETIATSGGLAGYGHADGIRGGIRRRGKPGAYWYEVIENFGNKPAGYLSWHRAARYCNWLHNGKPVGPQIAATTEQGAYTLDGNVTTSVARNS